MGSFCQEHPAIDPRPLSDRGGWALAFLLAITFGVRAIHPDQPIVENYVGRQIPTAMVARNLERGGSFLRPELDTGPFPNLFLVEPPIYAQVVAWLRRIIGFDLEPTARLVSAAATTLGAWGLFGLVRRREGLAVAMVAVGSFGMFPVMIRYGRAFQPDPLMLGCVLAGLRGWDDAEATGRGRWAVFGGFVLSTGLATKITTAWALIPFLAIARSLPIGRRLGLAAAMMAPALAWYAHAWSEVARPGAGSLASSDNAAIWLRSLSASAWLDPSTWDNLARSLVVRSFTPIGFVLSIGGLAFAGKLDRLWVGWAIGCVSSIAVLAAKWHHAYYWMAVAPLAALGLGRGLVALWARARCGRLLAVGLGSFFLALCGSQAASTFRTPAEWSSLVEVAREVDRLVPAGLDGNLIAAEALLYYADRRGYRLEFSPDAARRAAGEWGARLDGPPEDPLALTRFYLEIGAGWMDPRNRSSAAQGRFVADPGKVPPESRRGAWRSAIRADPRARVLVDRPDAFIAEYPR